MASMSDIRRGMIISWKNGLYEFTEFLHVKPGKGAAFVRSKLKNIQTGQVIENTFRASDRFEEIRVSAKTMQYLYSDGSFFVFMDNETYEQLSVPESVVGDLSKLMVENINVKIKTDPKGEILGIELPTSVEMTIADCEPNVKGNTASGGGKTATTETGLNITVPFFVEVGDKVKIDTRNGAYQERV
ncbi:MAG: elongation factor P [Candidatus Cloacimonadota bacterium]|nr:MAG: elongation factor P [Candidatus Cloacimonadota bacterium]